MTVALLTRPEAKRSIHDLRSARRERRVEEVHFVDVMYKAYITAILVFLAALGIAKVLGDTPLTGSALHDAETFGPQWTGLVISVVLALALRSGARGGPLAPEAPDVTHLLLAPVPRSVVMSGLAVRQLRGVLFTGLAAGTAIGLAVGPRLGGSYPGWIFSCIAAGITTAVAAWALAAIASGRRFPLLLCSAIGVVLIAWSIVDVVTHHNTSPGSAIALIAFLPVHGSPGAMIGVVLVLAAAVLAFLFLGGVALEAAQRRAALVGQLRFAATVQDMRAILVLQRQLAAVPLRRNPYLHLRAPAPGSRRRIEWRRGWRSILRFPPSRVLRHVALAIVIGVTMIGVVNGTLALVFVAGVGAWLLGNDVVEAFAQELDHPDIGAGIPRRRGELILQLLTAPTAYLVVLSVFSIGAACAFRPQVETLEFGAAIMPLAVGGAIGGAALTVLLGSVVTSKVQAIGMPELQGMLLVARQGGPPLLATLAFAPIAVATGLTRVANTRHTKAAHDLHAAIPGITGITVAVTVVAIAGVVYFVRSRKDAYS